MEEIEKVYSTAFEKGGNSVLDMHIFVSKDIHQKIGFISEYKNVPVRSSVLISENTMYMGFVKYQY